MRLGTPGSPLFGGRLGRLQADQVEFAAVEQFPLDGFASLHSDGGSQRDGEVDLKPGRGALGANGLDF